MTRNLKNSTNKLFATLLLLSTLLATTSYAQQNNNMDQGNGLFSNDPFRLFEHFTSFTNRNLIPRVDIFETNDQYIIKADVPGINPEDIQVTVDNNVLTISGEENIEALESSEGRYYRKERFTGAFTRQFFLPTAIDPDNIQASTEQGVLTILIPKHASGQPRTIEIHS